MLESIEQQRAELAVSAPVELPIHLIRSNEMSFYTSTFPLWQGIEAELHPESRWGTAVKTLQSWTGLGSSDEDIKRRREVAVAKLTALEWSLKKFQYDSKVCLLKACDTSIFKLPWLMSGPSGLPFFLLACHR